MTTTKLKQKLPKKDNIFDVLIYLHEWKTYIHIIS